MDHLKFHDKIALITGASSGIGRSTAILFYEQGAKLSLTGTNMENLEETRQLCLAKRAANSFDDILITKCNVEIDKELDHLVDETMKKFSRIDILINNAGIVFTDTIETVNMERYDQIMNVNVRAIVYLTHLLVPTLIEHKGSIVNVSSVNGIRSFAGIMSYCMSKAALDQFTRCTALDLASKGVRVNSVNPGVITTNIHKRGGMNDERYQQFLEHSKTTHAMGRVGAPEEVAQCIAFMASSDSSFVTGASLPIDGGRHAMCPR